jgi:hypothetical protein
MSVVLLAVYDRGSSGIAAVSTISASKMVRRLNQERDDAKP